MKGILNCTLLLLFIIGSSTATLAQRKANKQYELKAFNLAISSYLKYINQNPSNGEAMANLADSYRHINQMQEAVEWYERAFSAPQRVDPKHYLNYGKALMGLGKYEQAAREFRRYAQIDPEMGNHFYEMAVFANRNNLLRSKFAITPVKGLNTAASDFGATYFDPERLVYSSSRTDVGRGNSNWTGKAKNQLFLTEYKAQSGTLEPVKLIHERQSSRYSVGPVSYSADRRMVVITRNNFIDGTRHISSSGMKLDLYIATANYDGDWNEEEAFPWNSGNFSSGFAHIMPDGNSMYFASDRPGGLGGFDIYVSYKTGTKGDSWSTPENLGPNINTPGDEITPYFDGRTLYFASTWHDGYGGYDVFRSEGNNQQWGIARNMGIGINSPRDDYGFIFDGVRREGYFTSNREGEGSAGSEDIYRASRQSSEVSLRVIAGTDQRPIDQAIVDFSDCERGVFETDRQGLFAFKADDQLNCRVIIRKQGYLSTSLQLSALSLQNNRNLEVVLQKEGTQYRGLVEDVDTNLPLEGVRVNARNRRTNVGFTAMTDENGEYVLPLGNSEDYIIEFSKVGYSNLNRNVTTGSTYNRSILGRTSIRRVGSSTPITDNNSSFDGNPRTPNTGQAIRLEDLPTTSYAVQVAATDKPNLNSYADLNVHGNVYYMTVNKLNKVRVGVFPDKSDAEEVRKAVRKAGYKDAFIVPETTREVVDKIVLPDDGYITEGTSTNRPTTTPTTNMSGYKVQLAAYRDTKYFDASKVDNLGYIEQMRKGDLTVMFISGFSTLEEARRAMQQAKRIGFNSAFVVMEENGEIKRVNLP
ncbi:MAG: carboxypeptidase regulatory-like domain-containing protein [Bacteroidota bacterium]